MHHTGGGEKINKERRGSAPASRGLERGRGLRALDSERISGRALIKGEKEGPVGEDLQGARPGKEERN